MATDMGGFAQAGGPVLVDAFARPISASAPLSYRRDDLIASGGETIVKLTSPAKELRLYKNTTLLKLSEYTVNSPVQCTLGAALSVSDVLTVEYKSAYLTSQSSVVVLVTDPYFSYVGSLVHFNGTNGSTTFTDQKSLTWSANGDAALSTSTVKFGSASMKSSTGGAATTSNAAALGTGDFTIEFWIYYNTIPAGALILVDLRSATATSNPAIYVSSGNISYYTSGANRITGSALASVTWYHIALSRVSGNTRLFVNGTQVGSTYADSGNYVAAPITLMEQYNLVGQSNGFIDDFRFTVGVGRYTSNFAAPSSQFPDA